MHIKTLILSLFIGLVVGGGAVYIYGSANQPKTTDVAETTQQRTSTPELSGDKDTESGNGMSTAEMYDELQKVSDENEVSRKYVAYMLGIKNTEVGMARVVKAKVRSDSPLTGVLDKTSMFNESSIQEMLAAQKAVGGTDH